ncbi:hypothetical protein [Achromobacter mucicolens]|uniref:hypothetical protein n=1 Tax=Achromobacter mucicolens TaxID=1389922 RepID=UPI001CC061B3|nr:hypothetical protein [Achromobacter mucicolens]UAN04393.1 hypothetical protein K9D24_09750 [Achromobacter mucicolens]
MEKGILYNVVLRGGDGTPVGQIKDNRWYELGKSWGFDIPASGVFVYGNGKARIEGLSLTREDDGQVFDLVPA